MRIDRRTLLAGGLAAGAVLALQPAQTFAQPLWTGRTAGASRRSALFPGVHLVHGDLHNHSHLSDGMGDPALLYTTLRAAGIDVAALTDHTVGASAFGRDVCAPVPSTVGERNPCRELFGLGEDGWQLVRSLADDADAPARYTALSGFEWSSPYLGHMNVWFSEEWVDPLRTGGLTADGLASIGLPVELLAVLLRTEFGALLTEAEITGFIASVRDQEPAGMRRLYDWMLRRPGHPQGGGSDALVGFNHPNREPDVFDGFRYDERVAGRVVSLELFNRRDDYLFEGVRDGMASPLVACLNAGWRVGIIGVTDEHEPNWGSEVGKGRAGLWLRTLTRRGVRDALLSRRVFATREAGLALAATADGVPMGQPVPEPTGDVAFEVDLDLGPDLAGTPVTIQVLRPGPQVPAVAAVVEATAGGPEPIRFSVPLDPADGDWVVLRVSDPARPNDAPAPFDHPCNDRGLAYSSPWWLGGARSRPATAAARGAHQARRMSAHDLAWWGHTH